MFLFFCFFLFFEPLIKVWFQLVFHYVLLSVFCKALFRSLLFYIFPRCKLSNFKISIYICEYFHVPMLLPTNWLRVTKFKLTYWKSQRTVLLLFIAWKDPRAAVYSFWYTATEMMSNAEFSNWYKETSGSCIRLKR